MKKIILFSLFILFLLFIRTQQPVKAQIRDLPAINKLQEATGRSASPGSTMAEKSNLGLSSLQKPERGDNLEAAKIRSCEQRQENIARRLNKITQRTENQLGVFSQISERVQEFYEAKIDPQGGVVVGYEVLTADIASKGALALALVVQAQELAESFSCDNDHPAEQIQFFNGNMRAVIVTLNEYKKSIKNLIVAVRTAAGSLSDNATSSAQPL